VSHHPPSDRAGQVWNLEMDNAVTFIVIGPPVPQLTHPAIWHHPIVFLNTLLHDNFPEPQDDNWEQWEHMTRL
jgi:hypothetical protein